jgi:hypothetical protein
VTHTQAYLRNRKLKKAFGTLRIRWEDNINVDFKDMGCEDVVLIHLAQDRVQSRALMNMVMNLRFL